MPSALTHDLQIRSLTPADLQPQDRAAWSALEAFALEPNAFHSPHFVLPALQHLDPGSPTRVLLIETAPPQRRLVGAAAVRERARSELCPLPHLEIYLSRHSYLGAPLVHREHADAVLQALTSHLHRSAPARAGLVLRLIDAEGPLLAALQRLCRSRHRRLGLTRTTSRAMLVPARSDFEGLKQRLRSRHAEIERCRRRLAERGDLKWQMHRGAVPESAVEDFLRLEHQDWKAEAGSSLRASPAEESFFRTVSAGFSAEGRGLFTELRLDGTAIASTSNFISGSAGFAFKVGWDQSLRKFGPGILNEVELIRAAPQRCADLHWIDSGAGADSFIDRLWPDRRQLVNAFVPHSAWGDWAWRALDALRRARQRRRPPAADRGTPAPPPRLAPRETQA